MVSHPYSAEWVEPIQVKLKNNLTFYSHPPPGSGVLTAYIMRLLDGQFSADGMADARDDPLTYHRIAEAIKHAFAQRTKLSDPRFHPEVNEVCYIFRFCSAIRKIEIDLVFWGYSWWNC